MYFLDRFNADTLFSFNFDALDLTPSFQVMDMALAAPRFIAPAVMQIAMTDEASLSEAVSLEAAQNEAVAEMPEASTEMSQNEGDDVAPGDDVNAPQPPEPLRALINGTAGDDDPLNGTEFSDTINGLGGNDVIFGLGGADVINGGDGDDTIDGGATADQIFGGNGNDYMILRFNDGSDDFDGGDGIDTLDLTDFTTNITANLAGGLYQFGDALNIENVYMGSGHNNITGSDEANEIRAGAGNDTVNAQAGNDTILGEDGNDLINAGDGNDTINGGTGSNTINGDAGNDTFIFDSTDGPVFAGSFDGGAGTDRILIVGSGDYDLSSPTTVDFDNFEEIEFAAGTFGTRTLMINSISLTGTSFSATGLIDAAFGWGADILEIHMGANNLDASGWVFQDWSTTDGDLIRYIGDSSNETITGTDVDEIYLLGDGIGTVNAGGGNDFIQTGDVSDTLNGGDGDDILIGGGGADALDGGAGIDTADYSGSLAGVNVDMDNDIYTGGDANFDTLVNIENLIGSGFDDLLVGEVGVSNLLMGGLGDDTINIGGPPADEAYGEDGDDTFNLITWSTTHGAHIFDGGNGVDTFRFANFGSSYEVDLQAGTFNNLAAAGNTTTLVSIENVDAGSGADLITGSTGDNEIYSGFGNDTVNAGEGMDLVDTGGGDDTIIDTQGTNFVDHYDGGSGTDLLRVELAWGNLTFDLLAGEQRFGANVFDTYESIENINVGGEANVIGTAGDNVINALNVGVSLDNTIDGGDGNDTINTNDGNDIVMGGAGADTMDGGAGQDTLDYSTSNAGVIVNLSTNTASGGHANGDVITNFENVMGSAFDDILTTDGATFGTLWGGDGDDQLFQGSNVTGGTLNGGNGDDIITSQGTMSGTTLNGGDGNDTLYISTDGGVSGDTGNGGAGNDLLYLTGGLFQQHANGGTDNDTLSLELLSAGYAVDVAFGTIDDGDGLDNATFSNIEIHVGSTGDDTYDGSAASDTLNGFSGDDTLNGGDGDDVLDGGGGNLAGTAANSGTDVINGGNGDDTIIYSRTTSGGTDVDFNDGGLGIDTFVMSHMVGSRIIDLTAGTWNLGDINSVGSIRGNLVNIENVRIESDADIDIRGDGLANDLSSTSLIANNEFEGMGGDDVINAGGGDDRVAGGAGADNMDGGDGLDTLDYTTSSAGVTVNLAMGTASGGDADGDVFSNFEDLFGSAFNDILTGDLLDNQIFGGAGNDRIDGGAGEDFLVGEEGADTFLGGAGADFMDGGAGLDTIDYRGAASRVVLNLDTGGTLGDASGDAYVSIERVYGSDFNDTITGTAANEFFFGEDGNDTINGGDGIDRIYGGDGNDIQRGDAGNDTLYGSAGNDQLNGGVGFDIANYSNATNFVSVNLASGGAFGDALGDTYFGIEAVYGSDFDDILVGNNSANELRGGDGDDTLSGSGGNDRLFGGEGADSFNGGSGVDIVSFTAATAGVVMSLASGGTGGEATGDSYTSIEWIFGSDFNDQLFGDSANNRIEGRDGADFLFGDFGNDRLLGGEGNDLINGGAGVDTIFGQAGINTLYGGNGNDFFFGGVGTDAFDGENDFDTVSYLASTSAVFLSLSTGGFGGDANGDSYVSIERIFGSQHNDYIEGGAGDETLLGNGGDDYLEGLGGNDSLFGGFGIDDFGYNTTNGDADVINDFNTATGEVIFIRGGDPAFDTFAEIMAVAANAGGNTIFSFGGGNTLTIVGSNIADLAANDFDFSVPQEPLDDGDLYAGEPLTFDEVMAIHQEFAANSGDDIMADAFI